MGLLEVRGFKLLARLVFGILEARGVWVEGGHIIKRHGSKAEINMADASPVWFKTRNSFTFVNKFAKQTRFSMRKTKILRLCVRARVCVFSACLSLDG